MEQDDFPFELVYEHFARLAVDNWPTPAGNQTVVPMLFSVSLDEDGKIEAVMAHPVELFFQHDDAMERLGMLLDSVVPDMPPDLCMVLISEALIRVMPHQSGQPFPTPPHASLADDPDARECVVVNLYRPGTTRIGRLMRGADGKLVYAPLDNMLSIGGRLIPEPGPGDAPVH